MRYLGVLQPEFANCRNIFMLPLTYGGRAALDRNAKVRKIDARIKLPANRNTRLLQPPSSDCRNSRSFSSLNSILIIASPDVSQITFFYTVVLYTKKENAVGQ